ncbi:MAG: four helix bundle protein [Ignavibacteriae bacterium]|nr:four helix bundle protein [Ignavibacteria bacterium]MBI3364290.1 four helix bundle protein [Ignavibacteriota bacterium]
MDKDIKERTFAFGLRIITLSYHLPENRAGKVLCNQILRSGTSIGANVEEAVAAYSREDFTFKMNIALKEARETHYWLRMIEAASLVKPSRLSELVAEAEEIKKVLGSIVSKMRKNSKGKSQK